MTDDERYLSLIIKAVRLSAEYKPMFGQGRSGGLTLEQFTRLYGADPFYCWCGLDSPLIYSAHRVSGGLTSMYRQIGMGCQWALNAILRDALALSEADANWSYTLPKAGAKPQTLSLDARIPITAVTSTRLPDVRRWLVAATTALQLDQDAIHNGAVFEIRQGYKSKDAKRQNADVANAANAYAYGYLPVVALLSNQIDSDVARRYQQARWLILRGTLDGTMLDSLYVFYEEVIGYDLAGFFTRNSATLQQEIHMVMEKLLGQP